jgi:hypothetical protein
VKKKMFIGELLVNMWKAIASDFEKRMCKQGQDVILNIEFLSLGTWYSLTIPSYKQ